MDRWLDSRPLKWKPVWLAIGWLLVALVVYLSLAPKIPKVVTRIPEVDKIGHFLAYFTLMAWFGFIYLRRTHIWIASALVVMGASLEVVQHLSGYRVFEWWDIITNIGGVAMGWALVATRFAGLLLFFERRLVPPDG